MPAKIPIHSDAQKKHPIPSRRQIPSKRGHLQASGSRPNSPPAQSKTVNPSNTTKTKKKLPSSPPMQRMPTKPEPEQQARGEPKGHAKVTSPVHAQAPPPPPRRTRMIWTSLDITTILSKRWVKICFGILVGGTFLLISIYLIIASSSLSMCTAEQAALCRVDNRENTCFYDDKNEAACKCSVPKYRPDDDEEHAGCIEFDECYSSMKKKCRTDADSENTCIYSTNYSEYTCDCARGRWKLGLNWTSCTKAV